jgi:NADPH:quinone reductase-like Zn-dependent oxidoreductase
MVTRGDTIGVRGVEYRFTRLFTGIRRPRRTIFGSELAGRVEEVGATVTGSQIWQRPPRSRCSGGAPAGRTREGTASR